MSKRPTYEIDGEVTRFDERDTLFSREALVPGSQEELDYHERRPEKREVDERLARFILYKMEEGAGGEHLARAVYESNFLTSAALALPDQVDGNPASNMIEWDPKEAAKRIKEFARTLGAEDVRIGPLSPEWVYSHKGSQPFFGEGYTNPPYFNGIPEGYQGARYGDPIELGYRHAVSMAFRQEKDLIATGATRAVDFEVGRVYLKSVIASVQLARFIRALGYPARAHHLRNYLVMLVPVAVDAGIGELARTGYVVSRTLGADFRLSCVTTDLPLEHDGPGDIGMQDFCSKCGKCAVNCPAQAIPMGEKTVTRGVRKWKLDEEACLLYWGSTGYTCGICQAVCPWTKPSNTCHRFVAAIAVHLPFMRRFLVWGDDVVYGARFRPRPLPDWLREDK
ncbi:MAG: reductive dehalogenase [Candidatus Krumholzibacteria bacterium]|nr:reductive dehalogenase [Candidatus Krumholzibacteria bacterium]